MAINVAFSLAMVVLLLSGIAFTQAQFPAPKELAPKLSRNNETLSIASTDFGNIVHETPVAVLEPCSVSDISSLINFSNSLITRFTIAPRGKAHSTHGQANAKNGVVVNMTNLNGFRNGSGILVSACDGKNPLGCYADVGGEQLWIDILNATLKRGLTPLSWTDYLYLTVGGTLSNAGISGQTFRFGPQISNVLEMDVVTGKGKLVPCSKKNNKEIFYAVLGGLGQFGVKWLRLLYSNFTAFSRDQEHIISFSERNETIAADYLEGFLLLNQPLLDLSFYPASDHQRIKSLVNQYGIIYVLDLAKYYDNNTQAHVNEGVAYLVKGFDFVPTFTFEKDASYMEFMNRLHYEELFLKSNGLWENVAHPWLDIWIPRSRISDFNEGVFKNIILKKNITGGTFLVYPMNRNK
ncbi:hypothetical protein VNO78_03378 [Psophocarpus tetragonolobus]|uniref:cytokinin dehydrogenase n=1 Tax=Psophocarpus tetragonolobus TaxID=3891 RepID=A0AAN9T114_PSOTE